MEAKTNISLAKRVVALFLVIALFAISLPNIGASAATGDEFVVDGITYVQLSDGTVQMGNGEDYAVAKATDAEVTATASYNANGNLLGKAVYNTTSGVLTVPNYVLYNSVKYYVSAIAENAFNERVYRADPDSTGAVDSTNFTGEGYVELTNVDFSETSALTTIGASAFSGALKLTNATWTSRITTIGAYAFHNNAMTKITLPVNLTSLGVGAFGRYGSATNLAIVTEITLNSVITTIPAEAFRNVTMSGTDGLVIPAQVTSIGANAFDGVVDYIYLLAPTATSVTIGTEAFGYGLSNGATSARYLFVPATWSGTSTYAIAGTSTAMTFKVKTNDYWTGNFDRLVIMENNNNTITVSSVERTSATTATVVLYSKYNATVEFVNASGTGALTVGNSQNDASGKTSQVVGGVTTTLYLTGLKSTTDYSGYVVRDTANAVNYDSYDVAKNAGTKEWAVDKSKYTTVYVQAAAAIPAVAATTYTDTAYIHGYANGTFKPNGTLTRAEAATMLYNLLSAADKATYETTTNTFSDVNSGYWANTAVSTLANMGIIDGYSDGTFKPRNTITRAELAKMIVEYAGVDVSTYTGTPSFSDVSSTHWAAKYVAYVQAQKWVDGYNDGTYRPSRTVTRAETVKIINGQQDRACDATSIANVTVKSFSDVSVGSWYYYYVIEAANTHTYTVDSTGKEVWVSVS